MFQDTKEIGHEQSTLEEWSLRPRSRRDIHNTEEKTAFILATTAKILPEIYETQYQRKSDFYSLFVAVSRLDQQAISLKDAEGARNALLVFAEQVKSQSTGDSKKYLETMVMKPNTARNRSIRATLLKDILSSSFCPRASNAV